MSNYINNLLNYIKTNDDIPQYFYKGLSEHTEQGKVSYILNHFTYYTANSWNHTKSIANNVKMHRLNIPDNIYCKFFELLEIDSDYVYYILSQYIKDFEKITYTKVFFNGRSGGYLVMVSSEGQSYCNIFNFDRLQDYSNLKEFKKDNYINSKEIAECYLVLKAFDKLCDVLRQALVKFVGNVEVKEKVVTIHKVVKYINTPTEVQYEI